MDSTGGPSSVAAVEPGVVLMLEGLQVLIDQLRADGRAVIGPTIRDGVVTHAEITGLDHLPAGVGDEQDAAHYRLRDRHDGAEFGYTVPAASWKGLLFPAQELIRGEPEGPVDERPYALFGVRSCDLHALRIHDRVLLGRAGAGVDVRYARRRQGCFIVAVTCTEPGGTCLCASMATGPLPDTGFDLCLTELQRPEHRFLAVAGSEPGEHVLGRLPTVPATTADLDAAAAGVEQAARRMGRRLQTDGLKELLHAAAEHPHWEAVAQRCLACSNCTLVCPTCFCTTVEDTCDLAGTTGHRWREWDSCFTTDFSYLHGGSVRDTTSARYRQWVIHKLASWVDQFGTSGCVGCGRCITCCPVGIDLTAEVAAIRAAPWPTAGTQV